MDKNLTFLAKTFYGFEPLLEKELRSLGAREIKMGNRLGDNASMAMIELVDFNEVYNKEKSVGKKSTRRSRSRKKGENIQTIAPAEAVKEQSHENIKEKTLEKSPKSKVKKTANKFEDKKASEPEKEGDE